MGNSAENTSGNEIRGVANIADFVRNNSQLSAKIAAAADGFLAGVTSDKKEYAGGVAGLEKNTLKDAPENIKKMGEDIAAKNAVEVDI